MANTLSNVCMKISITLVEVWNREGGRERGTLGMQKVLIPTRSHTLKTADSQQPPVVHISSVRSEGS